MLNSLVSIVIPCYNDFEFVGEAVNSAINQTYKHIEIIIVDDGSNLETKKVLKAFNHQKIKIISQENKGLSAARNKGIKESKGEFVLLLDSDDKFDLSFISKAMKIFEKEANCGVVTCWGEKFMNSKSLQKFKPTGGVVKNFLFQNSAIGTSIMRKLCWHEIGGYDENMKHGYEDWEFYIRLTKKWKVCVIPEVLFFYRQREDSMRKNAIKNYDKHIKEYILKKHKDLYVLYYDDTVDYFLKEIDNHRLSRLKLLNSLDYRIGNFILKPLRWVKFKIKEWI